jgi:hypothetical protein
MQQGGGSSSAEGVDVMRPVMTTTTGDEKKSDYLLAFTREHV